MHFPRSVSSVGCVKTSRTLQAAEKRTGLCGKTVVAMKPDPPMAAASDVHGANGPTEGVSWAMAPGRLDALSHRTGTE